MEVVFERRDAKRYLIGVRRNGRHDVGPDIPLRPGPGGVGVAVPHDLVHFVIEEALGLRLGIFGQVAAGGGVGFFTAAPQDRRAARDNRRSKRLGRAGRQQVALSERVAALVDADGRLHREGATDVLGDADLDRVASRLADVGSRWRRTPAGGQLVLTWPVAPPRP